MDARVLKSRPDSALSFAFIAPPPALPSAHEPTLFAKPLPPPNPQRASTTKTKQHNQRWDMEKLVAKLKVKLREHARGIAGYQFLAACKLFREEVAPGHRKGGRICADDFRRVVEYKFGMKLDPDEVLTLFHFLVPGTGDTVEISAMVSVIRLAVETCRELAPVLCVRPLHVDGFD